MIFEKYNLHEIGLSVKVFNSYQNFRNQIAISILILSNAYYKIIVLR